MFVVVLGESHGAEHGYSRPGCWFRDARLTLNHLNCLFVSLLSREAVDMCGCHSCSSLFCFEPKATWFNGDTNNPGCRNPIFTHGSNLTFRRGALFWQGSGDAIQDMGTQRPPITAEHQDY